MPLSLLVILLCAAHCYGAIASTGSGETGAKAGAFSSYVLAQSWSPEFCRTQCDRGSKSNCRTTAGSYAASHLSLHGLWPNFADTSSGYSYPQYCNGGPAGDFEVCASSSGASQCQVNTSTLKYFDTPDKWQKYAPGYGGDDHFLANHEWPKHGSCVGEGVPDAKTFFLHSLSLDKQIAEGPVMDLLIDSIGSTVSASALLEALGGASSSRLTCDHGCILSGVYTCWGTVSNTDKSPGQRKACPSTAVDTCGKQCPSVRVNPFTPCGAPPAPIPGEKCVPGKHGPPCSRDSDCTSIQECIRCARSGYCTAQPDTAEW